MPAALLLVPAAGPVFAGLGALAMPTESVVVSGSLPVALLVAVAAGVVSFASPCVLPLVPGFLGYVTGLSAPARPSRGRAVLGTALFVLGFTLVYVVGLASVSVATALIEHQRLVMRIGGAVVILLALVFLGYGERFGGQSQFQPRWRPAAGLAGAPLLGAVFAVGWTPCSGPTLGAITALAVPAGSSGGSVGRGVALATAYSLGLGIPFLVLATGWSRAQRASAWLSRHKVGVKRFGGILLLVIGLLLVTGTWEGVTSWLQTRLIDGFTPVI